MLYDYQSKLILPTLYNIVVLYYSEVNLTQYLGTRVLLYSCVS